MNVTQRAVVAALVLMGCSGGTALAGDDGMFAMRVCNKSGKEASVAVSARLAPGSPDFVVQGWWRVPARRCVDIGSFPRGHFYAHAVAGRSSWGDGDMRLCVESPGPFKRVNFSGYQCSKQLLRRFTHVNITTARWTWNLT
jgi:uncharacterized membrane protein